MTVLTDIVIRANSKPWFTPSQCFFIGLAVGVLAAWARAVWG